MSAVIEAPAASAKTAGPSRGAWVVWAVAVSCYFAALFHRASLAVAADAAAERFSVAPTALSVFSALQLGVYLALQIPAGLLADRLGPRRVITAGALVLAVGSLVFAVSASMIGGVAGRALIGMGDAVLFTNVLRLAAQWFPAERFGRVAALTGLVGGLGQLAATSPLGFTLRTFGWLSTFAAAAALTATLGALAWMVIRDGVGERAGDSSTSRSSESMTAALRAVVARRGTRHAFWVHFVLMSQFVALTTLWGPPWLIAAQGHDPSSAGGWVMLCVVGFLLGAWFCGGYVAGRPRRRERFVSGLSWTLALVWALIVAWPAVLPWPLLAVLLLIVGIGGGAAMLAFDGARASNATHRSGAATGTVNMGGFLAAVLIQLGVGAVLRLLADVAATTAYRAAFLVVLLMVLGGTVGQLRNLAVARRCRRWLSPAPGRCASRWPAARRLAR